ncbi:hypothetical protein EV176_002365 [Coemansia sp. RSA 451]|nr:hypothetical protein GGH98_001299 [Coemansia sp. RSA 454]KAJ2276496.1 hypothetical protein EV176_002365 [Coemansia sp. RSA 451]
MRILGVCIASLVIASALPMQAANRLVPRQGDLEAAIYDETADAIASDPSIADALADDAVVDADVNAVDVDTDAAEVDADADTTEVEANGDTADVDADEADPNAAADDVANVAIYEQNAAPLNPPVAAAPDAATSLAAYQQFLQYQAAYYAALSGITANGYSATPGVPPMPITPPSLPANKIPPGNGNYAALQQPLPAAPAPVIPAQYSMPPLPPAPVGLPVSVPAAPAVPAAVPPPPPPAAPAAPAPAAPVTPAPAPVVPKVPAAVPLPPPSVAPAPAAPAPAAPVPAAPVVPVPAPAAYAAPNPASKVPPPPPPAVPGQIAEHHSQTGELPESDKTDESSGSFNPLGDLFQGLSDGLGSLFNGLSGIADSSNNPSETDDAEPVAQPGIAV